MEYSYFVVFEISHRVFNDVIAKLQNDEIKYHARIECLEDIRAVEAIIGERWKRQAHDITLLNWKLF